MLELRETKSFVVHFSHDALINLLALQLSFRIISPMFTWNHISFASYNMYNSCSFHQVQPFVCGIGEFEVLSEDIPFCACHALSVNMIVIYVVPYMVFLSNLECYRVCSILAALLCCSVCMYGIRWTLANLSWNFLSSTSTSRQSLDSTRCVHSLLEQPSSSYFE